MPSEGYFDARYIIFNPMARRILNPWNSKVFYKKIASYDKIKNIVFSSDWVKSEIKRLAEKNLKDRHRSFS